MLTPVNELLYHKTFKLTNNPIIELEGLAISLIAVKLHGDQLQKLNEILQKLGIEPLKDGDNRSEKLRLLIDKLHNHFFSETPQVTFQSDTKNNQCPHRVTDNRCSRFFLNKAKIVTVDPDFCNHCWELQQRLKATLPPPQTSTSNIYKKPDKIFCLKDYLWLDPLKCQAKCENCKLKDFYKWSDCQRNQSAKKRMEA